ncbi:hypothetical protein Leryth_011998 [Lithospermum erythrorhizon]|nr:hypothetical protein Leryth_011998 [Lithospermum erythrorhizon]
MDFLAGEKRPGDEEGLDVREVKRVKGGGVLGDVKKVAEMVLVLAGLGKIRGGRSPSEAERGLMAEARGKLVEVCQEFAPKEVFPVERIGGMIEDLGLVDSKEQRLAFRPPKMSISEKLLLSKRKFDEAKEFALPPPTFSQKFQGPGYSALERRGLSQQVQVAPQDKAFQGSIPSASLQSAGSKSTPVPYQLPNSEVRSTISNALPSSHLVKDSRSFPQARFDPTSVEVDGRSTMRMATWPMQPQAATSTQMVSENNVPFQSRKVDGSVVIKSGITPQSATTKPVTSQVATGAAPVHQNVSSMNVGQPSHLRNIHSEIANMVQKLLQRYVEPPVWTPPSRDYLNKPWACQMCKSFVTDADSLLICDNCEKGYHLKCLQTANHKRASKGEWHCFRCLSASHGKPLPPKYGRVMRNMNNTKTLSNTASVRPSPDRKIATVVEKPNLQKVSSNGNNSIQSDPSASMGNDAIQTNQNALTMQKNEFVPNKGEKDGEHSLGTCPNNSTVDHVVSSKQLDEEKKLVDLKTNSLADSEKVLMESHSEQLDQQSKVRGGMQNCMQLPSDQSVDNHITVTDSSEHCGKEPKVEEIGLGVLRVHHAETAKTTSSIREASNGSSNHSDVDWVGTMLEVADNNVYFQSCCINGVVYKLHDYVLVRFENGKLIPSKLQVMWEDQKTKSKWFTVKRCYFPSDLPETVGRPCGMESNEVYESTRGSTIMAGLIQGPCDVLPQNKFEAERERRVSSGIEGDVGLRPYYLCKWIYDEAKGIFREVSY